MMMLVVVIGSSERNDRSLVWKVSFHLIAAGDHGVGYYLVTI